MRRRLRAGEGTRRWIHVELEICKAGDTLALRARLRLEKGRNGDWESAPGKPYRKLNMTWLEKKNRKE